MREKITEQTKKLQQSNGGHIFYEYQSEESYIQNTVSYIIAGIEQGDHVIVIENDRVYPKIERQLQNELSKEDFEKVHRVNNFDFYCFKGDFNSATIISYFKKFVEPFVNNNISIRTWAHVEWAEQEQITYYVGEYEKEVDQTVVEFGTTSICAYDESRVPPHLRQTLLSCHRYYMTDGDVLCISEELSPVECV